TRSARPAWRGRNAGCRRASRINVCWKGARSAGKAVAAGRGVTGGGERVSGEVTTPSRGPDADPEGGPAVRTWPVLVVASALALVLAVIAGMAASAAGAELTRGPNA